MLLHDWLVILTAQYNDASKIVQFKNGGSIASQIDVAFSQCPQLQPLPRLVFALLRNPLLQFHEEGVHPDYRIYLQCLCRYTMFTFELQYITWLGIMLEHFKRPFFLSLFSLSLFFFLGGVYSAVELLFFTIDEFRSTWIHCVHWINIMS
jgi:hypothetical protein